MPGSGIAQSCSRCAFYNSHVLAMTLGLLVARSAFKCLPVVGTSRGPPRLWDYLLDLCLCHCQPLDLQGTRAGVATLMVHFTGNPIYDAAGSITIGALLGATACFLIQQNRSFLIGGALWALVLSRQDQARQKSTSVPASLADLMTCLTHHLDQLPAPFAHQHQESEPLAGSLAATC